MDAVTAAGSINADAFVSQHIGDMENAETYDAWLEAKRRYEGLFELEPQVVACDMHPEYLTSKWAHENARQPRAGQFDETRFEKSGQKGEGASLSGELCCEQQAGSTETHDGQRAGSAETRDEQRAARDEDCTERLASPSAGTSLVEVQHHHAHIVSAMAENNLSEAVCGIAFDGTGYGVDGCIWGGEVLLSNLADFERFANFAYVPMPGGAAAIKNPLRMAYGALWAFDLLEHPAATRLLDTLGAQAGLCEQMIEQGINTPMTSSVGRLFDAASAILGICTKPSYEGEGAILLEAAIHSACLGVANAGALVAAPNTDNGAIGAACPDADPSDPADGAAAFSLDNGAVGTDCAATPDSGSANAACPNDGSGVAPAANAAVASDADADAAERYAVAVTKNVATESSTARDTSVVLLDAAPTFRALLDDVQAGVPTPTIARRFHEAMIGAVVVSAELVRAVYGIDTVALSGGVFMNRYLLEGSLARLERAGFSVAVNRDLPPNDGCISVGQAVVAWAKSQYAEGEPAAQ